MEEGTHGPLISQVSQIAHSKNGIKREKLRLAEEREVSEKGRKVGQEEEVFFFKEETLSVPARLQNMGFVYTLCLNRIYQKDS